MGFSWERTQGSNKKGPEQGLGGTIDICNAFTKDHCDRFHETRFQHKFQKETIKSKKHTTLIAV